MPCISFVKERLNSGFTLVEVLVIAPIIMISITILVAVIISLTGEILRTEGTTKAVNETQAAVSQIEADVRMSTQFLSTSYLTASPQGISGTNFDTTGAVTLGGSSPARLILRSLTTTASPLSSTKQIIYRNSPICSGINAIPYNVDIVYYLKADGTLWRRVIDPSLNAANNVPAPCSTPWQAPSCSPGYSAAVCKAEDIKVADNISAMSVDYLGNSGTVVGSSPTPLASSIRVNLTTTTTVAGRTDTYTPRSSALKLYTSDPNLSTSTWNPMQLQNNWVDFGSGYTTNGYTITSSGVVMLKGLVRKSSGTPPYGEVVTTLPVGYRPAKRLMFVASVYPYAAARVDIAPNGQVTFANTAGANGGIYLALDGIAFIPSQTSYTYTALSLVNSWVPHADTSFAPPQYTTDRSGRVHLQGLVANGVTTDNTQIASLPASQRSDKYMHQFTTSSDGFGLFGISDTSGSYPFGVLARAGPNNYVSITHMFYPTGYSGSWNTLALTSGWLPYPNAIFSPGQYIKGSDGIVSLRGLIYGGTTGADTSVITTLPVGYRPKERILVGVVTYGAYGRIDILPDGRVMFESGSNGWLSLDGFNFVAEQ